jgi:aminoglycoside phosphotransferase (APT) family kinase protein
MVRGATKIGVVLAPDDPFERVEVPLGLVRSLLEDQHPDLAEQPLVEAGRGWDNLTFRCGDELAVRVPTRGIGDALIANEQRWLPLLAPRLPLPTPVPLRLGRPTADYPWRWSVVPWLPGRPALHEPFTDPVAAADSLGRFVAALRRPAPDDPPPNPYRGQPLAERAEFTAAHLASLGDDHPDQQGLDRELLRRCWDAHVAVPAWSGAPQWLHGDLHPLNLLVVDGQLSAVIDFGDVTAGDPATDLFAAWVLFDGTARDRFLARADEDGDGDLRRRGRGWALAMGVAYLANREDHNVLRPLGRQTVTRVVADWLAHP